MSVRPAIRRQLLSLGAILIAALIGLATVAGYRVHTVERLALTATADHSADTGSASRDAAAALASRQIRFAETGMWPVSRQTGDNLLRADAPRLVAEIDGGEKSAAVSADAGLPGISVRTVHRLPGGDLVMWRYEAGWFGGGTAVLFAIVVLFAVGMAVLVRLNAVAAVRAIVRREKDIEGFREDLEKLKRDFADRSSELMAERDRAAAADASKSKFLATMSHELRTPLNAIIGFSEIMHAEQFGPIGNARYQDYLKDVLDSGKHLLSLVDDLLDVSRLQVGKARLEDSEVDLGELLEAVMRLLGPESRQKQIRIDSRLSGNLGAIWGDERALRQVLINIVGNAIRYSREQGHVTISAKQQSDGGISIAIADNGLGISSEKLAKVFEPFVQGNDDYRRTHEGAGLGLAIAKSLVEYHDGRIEIDSTLDVGTTVRIEIPATRVIEHDSRADLTVFDDDADNVDLDVSLQLIHRGASRTVYQGGGDLVIGRPDPRRPELICDIVSRDPRVSRPHARVIGSGGQFYLVDQSRRGTWIVRPGGAREFIHQNTSSPLDGEGEIHVGVTPEENTSEIIRFVCAAGGDALKAAV